MAEKSKQCRRVPLKYVIEALDESDEYSDLSSDESDQYIPNDSDFSSSDSEHDPDHPICVTQIPAVSEDHSSSNDHLDRTPIWKIVQQGASYIKEIPIWSGKLPENNSLKTPYKYFHNFFDNELLKQIVDQSNLYAIQKNPSCPLNLTLVELELFLGTVLYNSIIKLPRSRMYWQSNFRINQIADVMSRKRWETIKSFLHFNDNSCQESESAKDKLFKVRLLIESLQKKFQLIPCPQNLCVDEQIVPFKGRSSLKQYNPKKPHKWGYNIFVLCDTKGIIYDFEIYSGAIAPVCDYPDLGASSNIVLRLAKIIPKHQSHFLYFDNWFTSLRLMSVLQKDGIYALGTVRQNRIGKCQLPSDSHLIKSGRGSFIEKEGTIEGVDIRLIKWADTRCVTVASTFCGAHPLSTVKRFDKKKKEYVDVIRPNIVKQYNSFMGGVDLLDGLIAYYRIELRSKKFYHRIFFHFLDVAVVNSWLLYRRDADMLGIPKSKQYNLVTFKSEIAASLIKVDKYGIHEKKGRPSSSSVETDFIHKKSRGPTEPIPNSDIRRDQIAHWPLPSDRQRCKMPKCTQKSTISCEKCKVHLCMNKHSNCFYDFY